MSLNTNKKQNNIFLDYAAGTPVDVKVFDVMSEYFTNNFYNPGGIYSGAVEIQNKLSDARSSISSLLSARPQELVFVDGGTEANNLALCGFAKSFLRKEKRKPLFLVGSIEHASVLETAKKMQLNGEIDLVLLGVDSEAQYDLDDLKKILRENLVDFMSLSYVNGETGTIQGIRGISKLVRHHKKHNLRQYPVFHTDAIQAGNFLELNVQKLGIDMMSINASKIYGPKKIAALYIKTGQNIDPLITGGDQELSMRAGTENIPSIMGFEKSFALAQEMKGSEFQRLSFLQKKFEKDLEENAKFNFKINALESERIPNIVNISIPHISSEEVVLRLDAKGVFASMKSACKSDELGDSHVILAMRSENTQSIRFSMGRYTAEGDIESLVDILNSIIVPMNDVYKKYIEKKDSL